MTECIFNALAFFFCYSLIAYLTLNFDLLTLTLGPLRFLTNFSLLCKYHPYQTINSLFIGKHTADKNTQTEVFIASRPSFIGHNYSSTLFICISSIKFIIYSQNNHTDISAYRVALWVLLDATIALQLHWKLH